METDDINSSVMIPENDWNEVVKETDTNGGIKFQDRVFKPSKYHMMIDPVMPGRPWRADINEDLCMGCGICVQQCPNQSLEIIRREETYAHQVPTCQYTCPSGIAVRDYLKLIISGVSLDKAWNVLTKANPFPAVTGRVCPHPCETACNRGCLDEPVNIN